ncbi:MAG: hypothetical protein PWQ97_471 [Tepidanaerobacteraceae bacterium]|nr:hypothetical protein [Tepidanaerobacteraceae bacterium]
MNEPAYIRILKVLAAKDEVGVKALATVSGVDEKTAADIAKSFGFVENGEFLSRKEATVCFH